MENFVRRFHGESVGDMWPATRAYDKDVCEGHMVAIMQVTLKLSAWRYIISLSGSRLISIMKSSVIMS
jgi:hypothetical protein